MECDGVCMRVYGGRRAEEEGVCHIAGPVNHNIVPRMRLPAPLPGRYRGGGKGKGGLVFA